MNMHAQEICFILKKNWKYSSVWKKREKIIINSVLCYRRQSSSSSSSSLLLLWHAKKGLSFHFFLWTDTCVSNRWKWMNEWRKSFEEAKKAEKRTIFKQKWIIVRLFQSNFVAYGKRKYRIMMRIKQEDRFELVEFRNWYYFVF